MNRIIALITSFIMMFSFAGCSALPVDITEDPAAQVQPAEEPVPAAAPEEGQPASPETEDIDVSEETEAPAAPEVYTLALDGGCGDLNYYMAKSPSAEEIMTNCVISLTEPDKYGATVPAAADRLAVSDDRMTWTFHIRGGLVWVDNNGIPTEYSVTAQDYLDAVRLHADPAYGIEGDEYIVGLIKGLTEYRKALENVDNGVESELTREEIEAGFDNSVGVRLLDEYTIEYTLNEGAPHFNSLVQSSSFFLPVEMDYYLEQGEEFGIDMEHVLYSGPYVVSHFERDKRVTLTANPAYYDADEVSLKAVEYIAPEQGRTEAEMFIEGKLSYAAVTVDDYISMQHGEWESCLLPAAASLSTDCLFINFNSKNPEFAAFAQNTDFRNALKYSIDRFSLAYLKDPIDPSAVVRNTITADNCISDPSGLDYTDMTPLKFYEGRDFYRPDSAKRAMLNAVGSLCSSDGAIVGTQAGRVDFRPVGTFKVDGKLPVQLMYVCGDDNDSIILAHLFESVIEESIGSDLIDVEIMCIADWTKSSVIDQNNFDIIIQPVVTEYADPSATLAGLVSGGELNYGRFSSATYDALVESSMGVEDFAQRLDIFSRAEALILQENYILPLTSSDNAYCMSRSKPFSGALTTFGSRRFKGVEEADAPVTREEYDALFEEYTDLR